jgi:hypothetical protein
MAHGLTFRSHRYYWPFVQKHKLRMKVSFLKILTNSTFGDLLIMELDLPGASMQHMDIDSLINYCFQIRV